MNSKFKGMGVINPLYWVLFIWYLGQQARKKTYGGGFWPAIVTWPLGFAFSIAALITTKHFVGDVLGYGWIGWLPGCLFSAWVVEMFLWPFAFSISDVIGDVLGRFTNGAAKHTLPPFIQGLKKLPGSQKAWDAAEDEKKRKWFTVFVSGLTYTASVLGLLYLGGEVAQWAKGHVDFIFAQGWFATTALGQWMDGIWGLSWIASQLDSGFWGALLGNGWILGGFLGFVVFRLLIQPLFDILEHGEIGGVATIFGGASAYCVWTLLGGGLSLISAGAGVVTFLSVIAWFFPLLLLLFNEGLKQIGAWIKPLLKAVYDAEDSDWRKLVHHVVNILFALALTAGAAFLGISLGWSLLLTVPFAILTLVTTYIGFVYLIKHRGGNGILGFFGSAGVAVYAWNLYEAQVGWFGWLGASFASAFAALVFGLLIAPGIYRIAEFCLSGLFKGAGEGLDKGHGKIKDFVKNLHKRFFERAQDETFHDKTEFKLLFGEIANVLFAAGVFFAIYVYCVAGIESTVGWWFAIVGTGVVTALTYLIGGQLAKKEGGEPLIALLSIGAACYVGGGAFFLLPIAWYWALIVAGILATIAGYGVGLYVLPPVYWLIKAITNAIPDKEGGWKAAVGGAFKTVNQLLWDAFDRAIWSPLKGIVEEIAKFMAPILDAINKKYRAMMDYIDSLFNKKKA